MSFKHRSGELSALEDLSLYTKDTWEDSFNVSSRRDQNNSVAMKNVQSNYNISSPQDSKMNSLSTPSQQWNSSLHIVCPEELPLGTFNESNRYLSELRGDPFNKTTPTTIPYNQQTLDRSNEYQQQQRNLNSYAFTSPRGGAGSGDYFGGGMQNNGVIPSPYHKLNSFSPQPSPMMMNNCNQYQQQQQSFPQSSHHMSMTPIQRTSQPMMGQMFPPQPRITEPIDGYIYQVQFKRAHKNFILAPNASRNIMPGDFVKVRSCTFV